MTNATIIAKSTCDAYSAGRYGKDEWLNIAEALLKAGYTADEAECIMYSKYMRWAGDMAMVSDNPTEPTAADAMAYVEKEARVIRVMLNEPR